ncbi:MAG: ribokinase [Thermaceae bacterium]|nr:ribokinase [Thermaceae bacterium]
MVVVVGSLNMDLVVQVERHPTPGETVLGSDYAMYAGGKGANQAVAAARLLEPGVSKKPGSVRMIGRVGGDGFGDQLREGLRIEGIDIAGVQSLEAPTGVAFISIDKKGQNAIIVSSRANVRFQPQDLQTQVFAGATVLLMQLEAPLPTVRSSAELAQQVGPKLILNAAATLALSREDLSHVDVLVVNELEAAAISQTQPNTPQTALAIAQRLCQLCPAVVITLSQQGAVWADAKGQGHQRSFPVRVVDTTGAGDAFVGALAVSLCEDRGLPEAVRWGCAAGALATTKPGAQPSLPGREEVERMGLQ